MIKGVIFDMDGLLIDSEPLWRIAEIEAYKAQNCVLTDKMLQATMGMRNDEVVKQWNAHFNIDLSKAPEIELAILTRVQELVEERGQALPSVIETLNFFKEQQIPIALASSSPLGIIQSVVDTLHIEKYFKVMCSAEFEEFGKPHPAVFIAAANYLRIAPENCLVFEDSINGIIAAKAAKMQCIAVPAPENLNNPKYVLADLCLDSLSTFLSREITG